MDAITYPCWDESQPAIHLFCYVCRVSLHWCHNDHDGVSNHQPHGCLLNRLFRRRSKKTSKLRVTGLWAGNSPGPVNSPHKGPVTRKMFPFDDVIMFGTHRVGKQAWVCIQDGIECVCLWAVTINNLLAFYTKAYRVLKPSGVLGYILDVKVDATAECLLNRQLLESNVWTTRHGDFNWMHPDKWPIT